MTLAILKAIVEGAEFDFAEAIKVIAEHLIGQGSIVTPAEEPSVEETPSVGEPVIEQPKRTKSARK